MVDYVRHWNQRTEIPARQFAGWLGISSSKFHDWKDRYGKRNEHNAWVPRDWWLEDWEKQAIIRFSFEYPLEGYRRLAFMMLDRNVVAVIGYIAPADKLAGRELDIFAARDRKLNEAHERRKEQCEAARLQAVGQDLDLQIDALQKYGVAKELIFTDKASGATRDRAGLDACLHGLRHGDVLLVWRLGRLGRSVRHLVTLIDQLQEMGVGFRSVCDGAIDTTTSSGELIFHVVSALAQFERRLIQERTKAGIAAARARGRKGGRPPMRNCTEFCVNWRCRRGQSHFCGLLPQKSGQSPNAAERAQGRSCQETLLRQNDQP